MPDRGNGERGFSSVGAVCERPLLISIRSRYPNQREIDRSWIPAFAGMTTILQRSVWFKSFCIRPHPEFFSLPISKPTVIPANAGIQSRRVLHTNRAISDCPLQSKDFPRPRPVFESFFLGYRALHRFMTFVPDQPVDAVTLREAFCHIILVLPDSPDEV